MKKIGDLLRAQRENRGYLLRQVAANIEIDQALLSKIERNERMPTKDQVIKLAEFYKMEHNEFLVAFLSDKLAYEVQDEKCGLEALKMAEKKVKYRQSLLK